MQIFGFIWSAIVGVIFIVFIKQEKSRTKRVQHVCTITQIEETMEKDGEVFGNVTFEDIDTNAIYIKQGVNLKEYSHGQSVTLLVNENDTNDFIVSYENSGIASKGMHTFIYGIFGLFFLIGFICIFSNVFINLLKKLGINPFTLIPLLLGIIFFFVGYLIRKMHYSKDSRCNVQLEGNIVDLQERIHESDDGVSKLFHPVVAYRYLGVEYQRESNVGQKPTPYKIGQIVTVYINPLNPNEFIIQQESKILLLIGNIFTVVGSILLFVGLVLMGILRK